MHTFIFQLLELSKGSQIMFFKGTSMLEKPLITASNIHYPSINAGKQKIGEELDPLISVIMLCMKLSFEIHEPASCAILAREILYRAHFDST